MEKVYREREQCCGCGACFAKCPKGAIRMEQDYKGFLYPVINHELCIDCGLCVKTCDFIKTHEKASNIHKIYALQHNDKTVLSHSSSGGAFTALSDYILNLGGIIYGAVFDSKQKEVYHIGADTPEARDRMRGSKYVQSRTYKVFKEIKSDLLSERIVLFSGTPCQCAGLKSFLGQEYKNLYIVELLCHAVPSNQLFKDHIKLWEEKMGAQCVDYQMRSKKFGYQHTHQISFSDNSTNTSVNLKRILKLFEISARESCFNCVYTSKNRQGDITIGDLWEADSEASIYDNRGVSIVTTNTLRGDTLLSQISRTCRLIELTESALRQNAFAKPVSKPKNYDEFWEDYISSGYEFVLNKYAPKTVLSWGYAYFWRLLYWTHLDRFYFWLKNRV